MHFMHTALVPPSSEGRCWSPQENLNLKMLDLHINKQASTVDQNLLGFLIRRYMTSSGVPRHVLQVFVNTSRLQPGKDLNEES